MTDPAEISESLGPKRILPPHLREGASEPESTEPADDIFTDLGPDCFIELEDSFMLPGFEEAVQRRMAELTDRTIDSMPWKTRLPLARMICPKGFHGSFTDLHLRGIPDPFDRIDDIQERGWMLKGPHGKSYRLSDPDEQSERTRLTLGYSIVATPIDGVRGALRPIQTEVYYIAAFVSGKKFDLKRLVAQRREAEAELKEQRAARRIGNAVSQTLDKPVDK